jgi:hypothetical protein
MQTSSLSNTATRTPLEIRLELFENGYFPVLARGKVSDVTGWRTPVASFDEVIALSQGNPGYLNTGLLCGNLVAMDIDTPDPETSAAILDMALALPSANLALRRVGKAPKVTLLFRNPVARKKLATKAYRVNGFKCQVEIMGDGQQVIGYGIHPDTQMPYSWIGATPLDVPFAELPEIDAETIESFVADAEAYLAAHGDLIVTAKATKPAQVYKPTEQRAAAGDGIWAELKAKAMANLGAWVPDLGLSGTKTYEKGFLARADFRASTSSKGLSGVRRGLSVCFSPDGIVDYADGDRGYNPIDITAVVLGIDPAEAADWLRARVGDERPVADPSRFSALIARSLSGKAHHKPEADTQGDAAEVIAANDNNPARPEPPQMHPDPYDPTAAGGILADISRWITTTAIIKVDELSLAASIALIAGFFGSRALTPTNAGINMYLTTMVQTAGGKGRPPAAIRALADKAFPHGVVSSSDPTSYAAFERILRRNSSVVAVMDEFGITLQGVNSKKPDPVASSLRKFMLQVYDLGNGVFDGKAYASADTKKDDTPIEGPALTVLGMTTPETLYKGISRESVTDGFLNRFCFVDSSLHPDGIHPPDLTAENSPPIRLVERLRKAVTSFPAIVAEPGKSAKVKHRVPFYDGLNSAAHEEWNKIFYWQHDSAWNETEKKIRGRAAENTVRLATIRAISRNPSKPMVTVDDIQWGWGLIYRSIKIIESGVETMAGSDQEKLRNVILACLRKSKGGIMYRSRLLRLSDIKEASSGTQDFMSAITWLYMSGEVVDVSKEGDGSKLQLSSQNMED